MYRFYSVSEEAISICSTTSPSASDSSCSAPPLPPFFASSSPPLLLSVSSTAVPMLAPSPPVLQLHVPSAGHLSNGGQNGNNGPVSAPSPIFGVGVGVLLGTGESTAAALLGGINGQHYQHRRSIFVRQKSEEADRKRRLTMPMAYRMYESQSEEVCGTVRGPDDEEFHPEEGAKQLRQALAAGIQSNDQMLIEVLLSHTNFQRQKIATAYENMFGRVLADDIEEEAGGHFMDSILALLAPAHAYSARTLYFSITGKSYSRSAAVEIGLTSTAAQLIVIRDTYQTEFRVSLERDLSIRVEGLFGKILAQLLLRKEDLAQEADEEAAQKEADALFADGSVEELGRSLELFNRIFGLRGPAHIRAFVSRFDQLAAQEMLREASNNSAPGGGGRRSASKSRDNARGRDFLTSVRKSVNIHSDVKQAILLYVRISMNMQLYFAEKLYEAVSQARPDHSSIVRILVSRSEIDLFDICTEYRRKYGHHLIYDLQNMCSGDFLRLLNQLVNPPDLAAVRSP